MAHIYLYIPKIQLEEIAVPCFRLSLNELFSLMLKILTRSLFFFYLLGMTLQSHFEFITTPGYSIFNINPSILFWTGNDLFRITEQGNYSAVNKMQEVHKMQESKAANSYNCTVNLVITSRSLKVSDLQVL